MKKFIVALGVTAVALGFSSCNNSGSSENAGASNDSLATLLGEVQAANYNNLWNQLPDSMKQKLSKDDFIAGFKSIMEKDSKKDQAYLMGASTAMQLMNNIAQMEDAGVNFNTSLYISKFAEVFKKDSVDNASLQASTDKLTIQMTEVQNLIMKKREADQQRALEEQNAAAEPNIKAGKEYVESQKKADPSIKTTESGLSYKVIKEGTGTKPTRSDRVKVIYTGKHIDGSVFDSSNGQPTEFSMAGVVPGFAEALQLMAPGAKYVVYIPSELGYGVRGAGENIKPGETLVFELELAAVEPAVTKPAAKPAAAAAIEAAKK